MYDILSLMFRVLTMFGFVLSIFVFSPSLVSADATGTPFFDNTSCGYGADFSLWDYGTSITFSPASSTELTDLTFNGYAQFPAGAGLTELKGSLYRLPAGATTTDNLTTGGLLLDSYSIIADLPYGESNSIDINFGLFDRVYLYPSYSYVFVIENVDWATTTDNVMLNGDSSGCSNNAVWDKLTTSQWYLSRHYPSHDYLDFTSSQSPTAWRIATKMYGGEWYALEPYRIQMDNVIFFYGSSMATSTAVLTDCSLDSNTKQYSNCTSEDFVYSVSLDVTTGSAEAYTVWWEVLDDNGNSYYPKGFNDGTETYPASIGNTIPVNFIVYPQNASSTAIVRVCAMPVAQYVSEDEQFCAYMYLGSGYDFATFNMIYGEAPIITNVTTASVDEWFSHPVETAVDYTTSTLSHLFPFGIFYTVYQEWDEYRGNFSSSTNRSSNADGFYIGLNMSRFGLPTTNTKGEDVGGTIGFPISRMLYQAKEQSPQLFYIIDKILWGIFVLFLTMRVVRGTWEHGLERGASELQNATRGRAKLLGSYGGQKVIKMTRPSNPYMKR